MPQASGRRKNVLLIVVDQWRAQCLSYLGHPTVRTPNIDALCAAGVTFNAVIQDARYKYVHFDALPPLFFDLEADPGQFRNVAGDPAYASRVLAYAQKMLSWRLHHAERTLTGWSASPEGLVDRSAA